MRNQLLQARQLVRLLAVLVLGAILVACGAGDGDDDPTATTAPGNAQPTVAESGETPVSSPGTPIPANVDMSTAGDAATPVGDPPGIATPAPATPGPGNIGDAASPVASGSGSTSPIPAGSDVGDGTTGAIVPGTPAASPAGTPQASPVSPDTDASPVASLTVDGCDVANVPPFTGEATAYRLTSDLNFRAGPGAECDLALQQPLGAFQVVEVVGGPVVRSDDGSEWVQIETLGTQGWVAFEFLEPIEGE